MALEGQYRSPQDKEISGFVYHIAREKNRTRLSISQKMDLRDSGNLLLSLDLHSLLSAPHSVSFTNDGRSTHSNPGDPLPKYILGNLKTALSPISFQNSANLSARKETLS